MKLSYKISLIIFLGAVLAVGGVAYFGYSSQVNSLEKDIASNNEILAKKTMNAVDRKIQRRIEQIQIYAEYLGEKQDLKNSNSEYGSIGNIDEYISEKDKEWVGNFENENYKFANDITNNELSTEIRGEFQANEYYQNQYGYFLFPEVILTNKYGVNIAQTNRTSDFLQSDEDWWQKSRDQGLYVGNIEYDESSKSYSTSVSVKISDKENNFIGVLRAYINPEDAFDVVRSDYEDDKNLHTEKLNYINYEIINIDGSTIYSVISENIQKESVSKSILSKIKNSQNGYDIISGSETNVPNISEILLSYSVSSGYKDYSGLGWIVLIEHDTNEIFSSAQKSAFTLVLILIPIILLSAIIVIYIINKYFLISLSNITHLTKEIADGNMRERIRLKSKDEIGELSKSVDEMADKIQDYQQHLEEKVKIQTKDLEKFQLAVENASDHIVITDPDGIILYANKAVEKITGFENKEVIGKKAGIKELWGGNMEIKVYNNFWNKIKNEKKTFIGEFKNHRKDGEEYIALASVSPILSEDGNVEFFIGIERDITQEKLIDKAKTEFVSLASHQLRTPLSAVNWYAEMLLDGDVGKLNLDQKKYVEEIYNGNQRMVDLVNALLNVSRIELGTFAIEPEKTNVVEIAKSLLKEVKVDIEKKHQKVIEKYDKNLPLIMADKKLLRIVIQNLLTNAIKYTPDKGNITIEIFKKEPNLEINISDTGYGIPKSQQSRIFEKLFRADNIRAKDTEGTGLGLYIVKSIITQSGGNIRFISEENKGTKFYISLPLKGMNKKEGTKAIEDIK